MSKIVQILIIIAISLTPTLGLSQSADIDMSAYHTEISHVKLSLRYIKAKQGKPMNSNLMKSIDLRYETILRSGPRLVALYNKHPDKAVFDLLVEAQKFTKYHLYKSIDGDKFVEYSAEELDRLQKKDLMKESTEVLRLTGKVQSKYVTYFKRFALEFKQAFPAFTAAQGIIAAGDVKHNPMAIEQFLEQFKDPFLMTSSFGVFIGGSHLAQAGLGSKFAKKHIGNVSPGLMGNIGLGTGMFVSAVYTEIYNDIKNGVIGQCIADYKIPTDISKRKKEVEAAITAGTASNDELVAIEDQIEAQKEIFNENKSKACFDANQKWGQHDKYVNYTPDVTSLLAAAYLNHKTTAIGVKIMDKATFGKMIPSLRAFGAANPAGAFIYMTGNFVIFMKIHHKIMPYFLRPWNHINFSYLGFANSPDLKNAKAKVHSKYLRTYKANKGQVKWLEDNVNNLDNYLNPASLVQCLENAKKVTLKRAMKLAVPITAVKELYNQKARAEHCHQYYNPALIIENDYAFNKERKRLRLDSFSTKQANWFQFLGDFSRRSSDAKRIYNEILRLKKEFVPTSDQKYPEELNMDYFRDHFDDQKESYPKRANNIDFHHMSEYYIFQMACGPSMDTAPGFGTSLLDPRPNLAGIDYIKTPFGSSLEFVPPKVTTTDRSICDTKKFHNTKQALIFKRKTSHIKPEDINGVFNSYWLDRTRRNKSNQGEEVEQFEYNNLAEYVFDNIDPKFALEIFDADEIPENNEDYSWSTTVVDTLNMVWANYEDAYVHLVKDELVPMIIKTRAKGSISSISHQLSNSYKSFLRALDLKPLLPETETRLMKKLDLLSKTVKSLKMSTPLFEQSISDLKEHLDGEFKKHTKHIQSWDNGYNLEDSSSTLSDKVIDLIRQLDTSRLVLDHDAFYYSKYALFEVASDNCDSALISDVQNLLRKKYSQIKIISCQQKALANNLLFNIDIIERKEALVNEQLKIIAQEIQDYYKMINELLGTIGNFK